MKLHYPGSKSGPYGWGVFGQNITRELGKLCELTDEENADVVLMPLANESFQPAYIVAQAKVNLAVTFFESPLGPDAERLAKDYDVVLAGSSWCLDRMSERGIENGKLLIQGVDRNIFKPTPPRAPNGQFRIFSGGKFEYRKGQDLVIAAFKQFSKTHPDAHLVCSWFNPWPDLIKTVKASRVIDTEIGGYGQAQLFQNIMGANGIKLERFTILGQLSQPALAAVMRNTDVSLFPNRCEGGTNLVLMEYASCGRKVIANAATGHGDIAGAISYEIPATNDENHWAVQSVEDILSMLELAYQNRTTTEHWSLGAYRSQWTWEAAAQKIADTARSCLSKQKALA